MSACTSLASRSRREDAMLRVSQRLEVSGKTLCLCLDSREANGGGRKMIRVGATRLSEQANAWLVGWVRDF